MQCVKEMHCCIAKEMCNGDGHAAEQKGNRLVDEERNESEGVAADNGISSISGPRTKNWKSRKRRGCASQLGGNFVNVCSRYFIVLQSKNILVYNRNSKQRKSNFEAFTIFLRKSISFCSLYLFMRFFFAFRLFIILFIVDLHQIRRSTKFDILHIVSHFFHSFTTSITYTKSKMAVVNTSLYPAAATTFLFIRSLLSFGEKRSICKV